MSRKIAICAWLLATASATSVFAQADLLSELYGVGVHAYNSGDYRDAYENLTAAVEGGTRDPRAYYFRGLALAQLGRPEDARLDFAKGAQLEVAGGGDRYPIGRALERVQGVQRLTIERVRQIEKIKFQQAQLAESKRRYEDQQKIQAQEPVLRAETPTELAPPKAIIEEGVAPAGAEGDPFGDDGLGVGAAEPAPDRPQAPVGDEPAEVGGDDPFGTEPAGEEPAGEEPPAGDDPFGGEPAPAGDDPFGGEPAPAGDDPFGEPAGEAPAAEEPPAGDDPFGDAPAAEEPAAEEPAAEEPPAGDDPFGAPAEEEAPAEEAPADEPAPAGDDPFAAAPAAGGAKPAVPAGDPFGAAPAGGAGGGVRDVIRGVGAAIGEVGEGGADGRDPFDDSDEPKAPAGDAAPAVEPAGGDPFGAAPAAEAPEADTTEADDKEDPFADDAPAAEDDAPAGDDPFAN